MGSLKPLVGEVPREALVVYEGITTADGNVGGTTLICSALTALADFNGNQVIITSGTYRGQARDINGVTTAGTITVDIAFGGKIVTGTSFIITGIRATETEVATLTSYVGYEGATSLADKLTLLRAGYLDYLRLDLAGKSQIKTTTIDLNQIIGNYTLFTGAGQRVVVDQLIITMPNAAAGGALTSISIQTNDATPQVFITAVQGAVANLTAENQLFTTDPIAIGVGKLIQLTIAGGATGVAYVCTVEVLYHAVTTGGSLT